MSHELPHVLRARVTKEQLRPVDYEAVGQQVHDAAAEAERLDAAEALAEDGARGRPQSEHTQGERSHTHGDARACK